MSLNIDLLCYRSVYFVFFLLWNIDLLCCRSVYFVFSCYDSVRIHDHFVNFSTGPSCTISRRVHIQTGHLHIFCCWHKFNGKNLCVVDWIILNVTTLTNIILSKKSSEKGKLAVLFFRFLTRTIKIYTIHQLLCDIYHWIDGKFRW